MSAAPVILFAGGGTGGHVFPALAIADAVRSIRPDSIVSFAGARDRIEADLAPRYGYPFDAIWISGFRRRLSADTLVFPFKVIVSLAQSLSIIRRRRPDVVVGTGGYVSGPVVYAASMLRRRTLIQEQNEYPGVTTRLLARRVDEVHIAFESTRALLPRAKSVVLSGNPVRPGLARIPSSDARRSFGLSPDLPTVFAFGGSQGASSINVAAAGSLNRLDAAGAQLLWQTGKSDYQRMLAVVGSRANVAIRPFIDEMHAAYSAATLCVCRAGAASIAELTALGVPSILVPYPHAAADHQRKNARALENAGAAVMVEDGDSGRLQREIFALLNDQAVLRRMSEAAKQSGRADAADSIARAVLRLAASAGKED